MKLRISKAQSELIAGVLILSVIFTAVIPLMLRIQTSVNQVQTNGIYREEFLQSRREELLSIGGIPPTSSNLRANLVPGVWINNTGTIPVTLESLLLISKESNKLAYFVSMKYLENNPIVSWAILSEGSSKVRLTPGTYPTLQPGSSLLIRFDLSIDKAKNYIVKVVTSTGNILPKQSSTLNNLVPPAIYGGGFGWKGIFMPVSGFTLIGYNEIVKNSNITLLRGSHTTSDGVLYDDAFSQSFIWDDPEHPGFYMVTIESSYGSSWDVYTGFLGTYQFYSTSDWRTSTQYNYVNGYYVNYYVCDSSFNPETNTPSSYSGCVLDVSGSIVNEGNSTGAIREEDMDHNGVPELVLDTINNNNNNWYDTYAMKVMVSKDITNADFIRVSTKINYYWKMLFSGSVNLAGIRKLRIAMIAIYKLDKSTGKWVFTHYKDLIFSTAKPRTFSFDAVFPVNRTDIYRVAVFLYDPYTEVIDPSDNGNGGVEFRVGLEYVLAEWGVNNPYFRVTPTVYLISENDVATEGIGGDNYLSNLTQIVINYLKQNGISNYIVLKNQTELNADLLKNPPKNAIIINLLGETLPPIEPQTLKEYVSNYGWIWVNIVGKAPLLPSGVKVLSNVSVNGTILPNTDGDNMVKVFNLYGLPTHIVSNYTLSFPSSSEPSYLFYADPSNSSQAVSAGWIINLSSYGVILANTLPEIRWNASSTGSSPNLVAELAVYTPMYLWYLRYGKTSSTA